MVRRNLGKVSFAKNFVKKARKAGLVVVRKKTIVYTYRKKL